MDISVLDSNFQLIYILDSYESLIWTDRYSACGDFEICTKFTKDIDQYIALGNYIQIEKSNHTMIIESIEIQSTFEDGPRMIIKGRSLESILDRRIVFGTAYLDGNLQTEVKSIFNAAIINPYDPNRKISNFVFEDSDDTRITGINTFQKDVGYATLYDIITEICTTYQMGFQIILNQNKQFVFKLFKGLDRSYDQSENTFVVFSPTFDNLSESNYLEDSTDYKTMALIRGSDALQLIPGEEIGLNRREVLVDAGDISSSQSGYEYFLIEKGKTKLAESKIIQAFDGTAETEQMFQYGKHFFIGDIVQLEDEYGHRATSTVTEYIISVDESGYSEYPTFTAIQS